MTYIHQIYHFPISLPQQSLNLCSGQLQQFILHGLSLQDSPSLGIQPNPIQLTINIIVLVLATVCKTSYSSSVEYAVLELSLVHRDVSENIHASPVQIAVCKFAFIYISTCKYSKSHGDNRLDNLCLTVVRQQRLRKHHNLRRYLDLQIHSICHLIFPQSFVLPQICHSSPSGLLEQSIPVSYHSLEVSSSHFISLAVELIIMQLTLPQHSNREIRLCDSDSMAQHYFASSPQRGLLLLQ
eukprot:TRINITY_DN31255_c0_g1_i1.p1 TRINITY_DN31255_c0_g1~~TRINITY_DN31255_c0_g1_i1.p1  ORF type:complete len:240 (-),score=-23.91 TRINITY_DN31255_c0_g1_i1:23-742(-)